MIDKYLKLFGLNTNDKLDKIKKAYRKLAKQNHPDYYIDANQKMKQEKIMEKINEAYKVILNNFKESKNKMQTGQSIKKSDLENDYTLYKKAVEYYNIYFHSFFQLFAKREVKSLQEKEDILIKARIYFMRIIQEYPKSDWVYDSQEKLKKIDKTIGDTEESIKAYKIN